MRADGAQEHLSVTVVRVAGAGELSQLNSDLPEVERVANSTQLWWVGGGKS